MIDGRARQGIRVLLRVSVVVSYIVTALHVIRCIIDSRLCSITAELGEWNRHRVSMTSKVNWCHGRRCSTDDVACGSDKELKVKDYRRG